MRRERQINVLSLIGIIPLYIFMNATGFRIHMSENLRNEYSLIYVNHSWLVMALYVLTLIFFALSVFSFFIKPIFRTVLKISLLILSVLSVILAVKFDQPNFFLPLSGSYLVLSLSVFNDKSQKNELVK
jgi:hypothetical protein